MAYSKLKVVLCKNQTELNEAVNKWVNLENYKRLYTAKSSGQASHAVNDGSGNWDTCSSDRKGQHIVVIFGKPA